MSKKEGNIAIAITNNNITNPINRQVQSPPSSCNPTLATALLPPGEGSNSPPATVHLSPEGNSFLNSQANNTNNITINLINNQANSQGLSPNHTPAIAHLPPREGSNSLPGAVHLPSEDDSSSQQTGSTPAREENNSSQATSPPITNNPQSSRAPQAGHSNNPPGQAGKALGTPPGNNLLNLPRRPAQPPGKVTLPPHPPAGPTKVLPMKNLTLSGSLTFPTNLWPQHKGLFWLKGPTLWLPLGSLLT